MDSRKNKKTIRHKWGIIFLILLFGCLWSNIPGADARTYKVDLLPDVGPIPTRPALYDKKVQPLAMEQCAQCHTAVFSRLQSQGGRHQLVCTFCHKVYHTYAPGKVEYKDAIPKCKNCHGLPHGDDPEVGTCGNCHSNAHSPLNIPNITADQCFRCHSGPPQALQQYPSKHSKLECTYCHTKHGFIPKCADCHSEKGGKPYHLVGVKDSVCLSCHPVHSPLQINYESDVPQKYCAPCHKNPSHERVLKVLQEADSKHNTEVTCATCHDEHGKIPVCFKCHEPHRDGQKASDCLTCHSNPHRPLTITYTENEPQESCAPCHGDVYETLQKSNTRHTKQTCAKCHPHHGEIPKCQRCHGKPHGDAIINKFGSCGACHGIAHNVQGRMKKPQQTDKPQQK